METQREDVPARATVFRWCRNFTDKTRTTIFDLPRSGRPSTSISAYNIRIIKELLKSSPKQSLRTLAGEINCGNDSVRKILVEELQLRKVCSVWIPHELSQANKQERVDCASAIIKRMDEKSTVCAIRLQKTKHGYCFFLLERRMKTKHG